MDRRQQLRDARLYFVADRDGMARALDGALAGGVNARCACLHHCLDSSDPRHPVTRAAATELFDRLRVNVQPHINPMSPKRRFHEALIRR